MKLSDVTSRIKRTFVLPAKPAGPLLQGSSSGPILPPVHRRSFLHTGLLITGASVFSPLSLFGDENSFQQGEPFLVQLEKRFNELVSIPVDLNKPELEELYNLKLNEFLNLAKGDIPEFLNWYKTCVQNKDSNQRRDFVLRNIGKCVAKSYTSYLPTSNIQTIIKKEKESVGIENVTVTQDEANVRQALYLGELLKSYSLTVGRDSTSFDSVIDALGVADELMLSPLRALRTSDFNVMKVEDRKEVVANSTGGGIITLYDSSLRAIRNIPEDNTSSSISRVKQLIYEPLYDIEQMDDRSDLQDRYVDTLTENFFGLPNNQYDVEGLTLLLNRVGGTSISLNSTNAGWSPYSLMGVMHKNKPWFESAITECADGIKAPVDPNTKLKKGVISVDYLSTGLNALKFFRGSSLSTMKQSFYFVGQNQSRAQIRPVPAPPVPIPPLPVPPPPAPVDAQSVLEPEPKENKDDSNSKPVDKVLMNAGSVPITQVALDVCAKYRPQIPKDIWLDVIGWSDEKLAKPIEEAILFRVLNDGVRVKDKPRLKDIADSPTERHFEDHSWRELTRKFSTIAEIPDLWEKVRDVLDKRFFDYDEDAYVKEGIIRERPKILEKQSTQYFSSDIENLKEILVEGALPEIRGLGYLCQEGLRNCGGGMSESKFIERLKGILDARIELDNFPTIDSKEYERLPEEEKKSRDNNWQAIVKKVSEGIPSLECENLTEPQKLILCALKITVGDVKLSMSLMPDRKFQAGSISKNDVAALRKLWHNAYLLLAYTASQYGDDYTNENHQIDKDAVNFKESVGGLLERNLRFSIFELDGFNRSDQWGEKYGALMDLYNSIYLTEGGNNGIAERKEKALGRVFFDSSESSQDETRDTFNLHQPVFELVKKQKIENKTIIIMQAKFIQGVLNTAQNRGLSDARESLLRIGRSDIDGYALLNPYKYVKSLYKIDLESERVKEMEALKAERKLKAKKDQKP